MLIRIPKGWEIPERQVTPESTYHNRRELLKMAGLAAAGLPLMGLERTPGKRNPEFGSGLTVTPEWVSTSYNNFYELDATSKEEPAKVAGKFQISPWKVEIKGLCAKPQTIDLDALKKDFPAEERVYRMRCVERWAIVVPWSGFPLSELIKRAEPKPEAKYVRFITVNRPEQLPGMRQALNYDWPYNEGLRMDEAMNPLTMVTTGMYGKPLPKQNGAPIRIVTPWKYGYKSPKSIVTIEFTDKQPKTLWNVANAREYGFYSNVNPNQPHPRWSQAIEELLPDGTRQKTLLYNGYTDYVAKMYKGDEH